MYAAALVCMILQVGLDMLSPQVTARLIDDVLGKRQAELLPKLLLMIFAIGAGRAVFGYLKEFIFDNKIECFIKVTPLISVFGANKDFRRLKDEVL